VFGAAHLLMVSHDANSANADKASTTDLFPVVYQQLRDLAHAKMSREPSGHTLQTTALVHEVYVRLSKDADVKWDNPGHFFGAAAEAMRRILVERARRHHAIKRGGGRDRVELDFIDVGTDAADPAAMIALDEAITELKAFDERLCQVVIERRRNRRRNGHVRPHRETRLERSPGVVGAQAG
jgi:RNA polymerase sigma factor (TIGR02999 family)